MKTIFSVRSENRRWGADIIGPAELTELGQPLVFRGSLRSLGHVAGIATWAAEVSETAETWVLASTGPAGGISGELEPLWGAETILRNGLQGGRWVSLLQMGPGAVMTAWGYKRRSSSIWAYYRGRAICRSNMVAVLDPAVLAFYGLLEPGENNLQILSGLIPEKGK